MPKGSLIILSAPSGTGKSTICRKLLAGRKDLRYSISCTTREPRPGERNGKHYFFLDAESFKQKISRNEFLEWAVVHEQYYGTPRRHIEDSLQAGCSILLAIDIQGAAAIRRKMPDAILIFLVPPTMESLKERLAARKDASESVAKRLAASGEHDAVVCLGAVLKGIMECFAEAGSVNLVNAAIPLPTDPGTVSPGPEVPGGPGPDPGQPTAPPVEPGPVQPGAGIDVGYGVVVYPPDGWTVVGSESGQVVLQKAGAIVIIVGLPWPQSPADLATAYRDAFFAGGQFTANEPESGEIGSGIPAVAFAYTGILEGTQVDGAIVAGASGGTGVVVNVFAAKGGLQGLKNDIDAILGTIQVTGGGQ